MRFKFLRALAAHPLLERLAHIALRCFGAATRRPTENYPWVEVFVTVHEPFRYCCCVEPKSFSISGEPCRIVPMIGSRGSLKLFVDHPFLLRWSACADSLTLPKVTCPSSGTSLSRRTSTWAPWSIDGLNFSNAVPILAAGTPSSISTLNPWCDDRLMP